VILQILGRKEGIARGTYVVRSGIGLGHFRFVPPLAADGTVARRFRHGRRPDHDATTVDRRRTIGNGL
jgi:hypothetical protein